MKAYKIEILVIDFDELGEKGIVDELSNANFPNDCVTLQVKNVIEKDIGEWSDDHPLNKNFTSTAEYHRLFG